MYCQNAAPGPAGLVFKVTDATTGVVLIQSNANVKYCPTFLPTYIPGTINYFSADFGVSSLSNLVSAWSDQSGNILNATQITTGLQPTLSSTSIGSCIVFNGTTNGMMLKCSGVTGISTVTVCLVFYANLKCSGINQFLSTDETWTSGCMHNQFASNSMTPNLTIYSTGVSSFSTLTSGTPCIYIYTVSITSTTASVSFYLNGGSVQNYTMTVAASTLNLSTLDIGGWSGDTTRTFKGGIHSLITYNQVLSTTQRQQLEGHLSWKWWGGIGTTLPNTHPYYSISP